MTVCKTCGKETNGMPFHTCSNRTKTMTTTEHLERIKHKCITNLALAEKRTQGEWIHDKSMGTIGDVLTEDFDRVAQTQERVDVQIKGGRRANNIQRDNNAAFIATCAGSAEAGWRSTIAACELALWMTNFIGAKDESSREFIEAIIAAWPEELLATGRATV